MAVPRQLFYEHSADLGVSIIFVHLLSSLVKICKAGHTVSVMLNVYCYSVIYSQTTNSLKYHFYIHSDFKHCLSFNSDFKQTNSLEMREEDISFSMYKCLSVVFVAKKKSKGAN